MLRRRTGSRQASESLTYEPTAAAGTEATDAVSGITPETFASPDATLAWALEAEGCSGFAADGQ